MKDNRTSSESPYTADAEKQICTKLIVLAELLDELGRNRNAVKKLSKHPIHDFTDIIWSTALGGILIGQEVEIFYEKITELRIDFMRSRNPFIRQATEKAFSIISEIYDGDYTIKAQV